MTGTAQLCAQEMELALDDDDIQVETLLMDKLDARSCSRATGVFLDLHLDLRPGRRPGQRQGALRGPEGQAPRPFPRALRRVRPGRPHLRRDLQLRRQEASTSCWRSSARSASASATCTTPRAASCPRRPRSSGARTGCAACASGWASPPRAASSARSAASGARARRLPSRSARRTRRPPGTPGGRPDSRLPSEIRLN